MLFNQELAIDTNVSFLVSVNYRPIYEGPTAKWRVTN